MYKHKLVNQRIVNLILYILLIFFSVAIAWPFIWMVLNAIKTKQEIWTFPPTLWPKVPQWHNLPEAWFSAPFNQYLFNSVFTATCILIIQFFAVILASYAFVFLRFPLRNFLFFLMLTPLMIPIAITYIPAYIILARFHWLDTYYGLIISSGFSAFGIFLFRQGFKQLPLSLIDAAKIDGAGHLYILLRIVLPLCKPVSITFFIFTFVLYYNSYFWPLIITKSVEMRLITVGLVSFLVEQGYYGIDWQLMMAATTLAVIPLMVIFIILQKWFVRGAASAGIKG